MSTQDITYEPIDTTSKAIRLLRLSDRKTQGLSSCEMFHASLNDDILYEALSYSWGDPKSRDSILLNGNITSVTANLARALDDIRLEHGIRVLWVDALCINQGNTAEKNHQVKQMGAIYQKAERVVVWLGRPKTSDGVHNPSILNSFESFNVELSYSAYQPDMKAKWLELVSLCELPYWRRLWIVQEIGLACGLQVYHGRSYVNWDLFSKVRKNMNACRENVTLHRSLHGIAKTISEGVPGRVDQQREYQKPLWLWEMNVSILHLLPRAERAARASRILLAVAQRLDFPRPGRPRSRMQLSPRNSSPILDDEAFSAILRPKSVPFSIEYILPVWGNALELLQFPLTEENLRLLSEDDFESHEDAGHESLPNIPGFLPIDVVLAEALEHLPGQIEHVREHEREEYTRVLVNKSREVLKIIDTWNFRRLRSLWNSFRDKRQIFDTTTKLLHDEAEGIKFVLSKLPRKEFKENGMSHKLQREEFQKMDLKSQLHKGKLQNIRQISGTSRSELGPEEFGKYELRLREIEDFEGRLRFVNARHQEVIEYLKAYENFDRSLHSFDSNLKSSIQQPAFLLRTLLETCERSLCQDPRDKIYGLLGLASNIEGDLVVDYSKSMFELFWDVIWHTYQQRKKMRMEGKPTLEIHEDNDTELMRFSQLMQRSLGGPFPIEETFEVCISETEPSSQSALLLPGFIIGTTLLLESGNVDSMAGQYQNQADILRHYFRSKESQSSTGDMVTDALEQLQHINQERLHPLTTNYSYGTTTPDATYRLPQHHTSPAIRKQFKRPPVLFVEDSGLIGLTSHNARDDDLLVQFSNCDIAAIIRPYSPNSEKFMIVSRAAVARQFDEKRRTVSESSPELFQYSVPDPSTLNDGKKVFFWLDAVTLQELTCPLREEREYNFDTFVV